MSTNRPAEMLTRVRLRSADALRRRDKGRDAKAARNRVHHERDVKAIAARITRLAEEC